MIVIFNKSITIPLNNPIKYNKEIILKFCFILLFIFIKTNNPTPAPTNNPVIIVPNDIRLFKYNCVIITDAAQFGINPNKPHNICEKIGLSYIIFLILI